MKYLPKCFKSRFRKDKPGDKIFLVYTKCTHCSQTDPNGCWLKWQSGSFEKCKTCTILSRGRPQYLWGGGQLRRFAVDGKKAHFHRWGGFPLWKDRCRIFKSKMNPSWNRNTNVGMQREGIIRDEDIESMSPNQPEWLKQVLKHVEEKEETDVYLRGDLCQVVGKDGKTAFQAIEEFMTRMPVDGDQAHRGNFTWLMKRLGDSNIVVDFKQEIVKKEGDTTDNKKFLYIDVRAGVAA